MNGEEIAKIQDVLTETRNIVVMAKGEKSYIFPFLNEVFLEVDTENKRIVLEPKRFEEVALIED